MSDRLKLVQARLDRVALRFTHENITDELKQRFATAIREEFQKMHDEHILNVRRFPIVDPGGDKLLRRLNIRVKELTSEVANSSNMIKAVELRETYNMREWLKAQINEPGSLPIFFLDGEWNLQNNVVSYMEKTEARVNDA